MYTLLVHNWSKIGVLLRRHDPRLLTSVRYSFFNRKLNNCNGKYDGLVPGGRSAEFGDRVIPDAERQNLTVEAQRQLHAGMRVTDVARYKLRQQEGQHDNG